MCNKILTHLKAGAQKKIVLGPEKKYFVETEQLAHQVELVTSC
jgi:hypothetical protein